MKRVLTELKAGDAEVTITSGCDIICSGCPNNIEGKCTSEEKVGSIDQRAAEAMEVSVDSTYTWSELLGAAAEKVIKAGKLEEVCGDCEWIDICKDGKGDYREF
jgi:hypothetical protein